ncbi:hypothetical protein LEP1GSC026_0793 [Leptospira interrogans str. 2002000623]|nr:hypothetical protein LEP1GSC025_3453 [Leptospira interrogans str. 2002000621]EKQ48969.1 hypothetical protein LEP1GSC026_0793 [Leptospira interrogans str. 2002000623]EKR47523.1 hypothetical protein LEP1GSC097_4068 [Leptospira interrogans serovar Grippotyphosa str. UI 08368]
MLLKVLLELLQGENSCLEVTEDLSQNIRNVETYEIHY